MMFENNCKLWYDSDITSNYIEKIVQNLVVKMCYICSLVSDHGRSNEKGTEGVLSSVTRGCGCITQI